MNCITLWYKRLNCVREEKHTLDDIKQIQSLANTDTSVWPKDCLKLYLTNYLADQESKGRIVHFDSEIFNIRVVDSQIDLIIGTCSVLVNETVSLNTLEFIVGDLNCATDKGPNPLSVNRAHVYTSHCTKNEVFH